jgi:hypothetical protein
MFGAFAHFWGLRRGRYFARDRKKTRRKNRRDRDGQCTYYWLNRGQAHCMVISALDRLRPIFLMGRLCRGIQIRESCGYFMDDPTVNR